MSFVYTEPSLVSPYDCDFRNLWKPVGMIRAMQQAAGRHAERLGFGFSELMERGQAWVLSRFKVRFLQMPSAEQTIAIHTAPIGISQKIFFRRDFRLTDAGGELLALATSAWLLVDTQNWRMLPPAALQTYLAGPDGFTGLNEPLERIPVPGELQLPESLSVQAGYNAIDLLGHVNNTRYIEWATDCFPLDWYRANRLSWLQINYANDVRPGERVSLGAAPLPHDSQTWLVQGANLDSGKRAFEAALGWDS
jgi:acyl-ACP thioesterase